ncbi:hypothetical protein B0H16DRAFT_1470507 [Mycena metata]|uniref:Uncharacterized protein n=1 Tax=Mycena metata TaxID=1033252 RepID=A0AAD7HU05_9AGAR|nr:hypothetical protein B0H16DRAFT_1470507 [Mycena metata]
MANSRACKCEMRWRIAAHAANLRVHIEDYTNTLHMEIRMDTGTGNNRSAVSSALETPTPSELANDRLVGGAQLIHALRMGHAVGVYICDGHNAAGQMYWSVPLQRGRHRYQDEVGVDPERKMGIVVDGSGDFENSQGSFSYIEGEVSHNVPARSTTIQATEEPVVADLLVSVHMGPREALREREVAQWKSDWERITGVWERHAQRDLLRSHGAKTFQPRLCPTAKLVHDCSSILNSVHEKAGVLGPLTELGCVRKALQGTGSHCNVNNVKESSEEGQSESAAALPVRDYLEREPAGGACRAHGQFLSEQTARTEWVRAVAELARGSEEFWSGSQQAVATLLDKTAPLFQIRKKNGNTPDARGIQAIVGTVLPRGTGRCVNSESRNIYASGYHDSKSMTRGGPERDPRQ